MAQSLVVHHHLEIKVSWAAELSSVPPQRWERVLRLLDLIQTPCFIVISLHLSAFCFLFPHLLSLLPVHLSYRRTASSSTMRASPPFCFPSLSHPFSYLLSSARRITFLNCFQQSPRVKHFPFFVIKQQYKADHHKCDSGFACCTFHGGWIPHKISKYQLTALE